MTYSTQEKLACLERELKFRKKVYPRQVELGKMTVTEARIEQQIMQEIADDLRQQLEMERLL